MLVFLVYVLIAPLGVVDHLVDFHRNPLVQHVVLPLLVLLDFDAPLIQVQPFMCFGLIILPGIINNILA